MALVRSLRARVVLWVSVALVVLFAATGVVLDVAFRNSMDQARRELLEVQVLGLIALASTTRAANCHCRPTPSIRSSRSPNSGLYGALYSDDGSAIWQSLSLLGRNFPIDYLTVAGEQRFELLDVPGFPPLESLLMGITWEFPDGARGRLHVRDRAVARAVQRAPSGVSPHPDRLVPGDHADDARRLERPADVRAAAAAAARAAGARGRSRRAREADGPLSVGDRRPCRQPEHADRHGAAAPRALPQHARRSRA